MQPATASQTGVVEHGRTGLSGSKQPITWLDKVNVWRILLWS